MASYPTSVKSFTSKNTGDVIQAAHVNDIQDEVNALEAGLLNGTAPLNSSLSTVARLTVTGGLTVSGGSTLNSLNVDGGSTFGANGINNNGPLNVAGVSSFNNFAYFIPQDAVKVTIGSTWAASSNTSTIAWVAQEYLVNSSMHSTSAQPSRLTPQSTGIYVITAGIVASSNSTGYRQIFLTDSSGGTIARTLQYANVGSSDVGTLFQCQGYKRYDALGGYVVCVYQNVGASTLSLLAESWFEMHKL